MLLFLIDENRFRHHASGSLGGGRLRLNLSATILLLDEFYRTAVRLAAGKRVCYGRWYQ